MRARRSLGFRARGVGAPTRAAFAAATGLYGFTTAPGSSSSTSRALPGLAGREGRLVSLPVGLEAAPPGLEDDAEASSGLPGRGWRREDSVAEIFAEKKKTDAKAGSSQWCDNADKKSKFITILNFALLIFYVSPLKREDFFGGRKRKEENAGIV